ncbi:MAG: hypothetical protein JNM88_20445 [Chitinophagaceae bacterium]|nr:hypothetical protein [Chitinophagaceae bacterium]
MKETSMKRIKIILSFPTLTASNKFITIRDSQYIDHYRDFIVCRFPYIKENWNNVFDSSGNTIKRELVNSNPEFQLFVYKKGEQYGFYFDSLADRSGNRFKVDSFLRDRLAFNETLLLKPDDSLLEKKSEAGGSIHEIYLRVKKTSKWDCDTNHLYFSDTMKDVGYSFSARLDSIRQSKLFKIRQVSNGDPTQTNNFFRVRRETYFEMLTEQLILYKEDIEYYDWLCEQARN